MRAKVAQLAGWMRRRAAAGLRALGRLAPPDRRLVLFGAMNGAWYGDNSRHLYEWVLQHRPDLRPVWVTRSREVHAELRRAGKPVVLAGSWPGLVALGRARVACFTNSLLDIATDPGLVPDSLQLLALRHGRSVKRVRFARRQHPLSPAEARQREREGRLIAAAISTSEFISDRQEECLRLGRDKHVVTGYPRNDCLIEITAEQRAGWERFLGGERPGRVVLYAPSWRHGREPTRFFPFADYDVDRLAAALRQNGMLLLLRPHVQDLRYEAVRTVFTPLLAHRDCVRLATHEQFADVNSFLPFVDVLVSDYSALYHDFLLLDRPLLFVPYDYADFEAQNGFLYDYFAHLPGPAIASQAGLLDHLAAITAGQDSYRAQRRALRDLIHQHQDGRSCERVAAVLERMMGPESWAAGETRRRMGDRRTPIVVRPAGAEE